MEVCHRKFHKRPYDNYELYLIMVTNAFIVWKYDVPEKSEGLS